MVDFILGIEGADELLEGLAVDHHERLELLDDPREEGFINKVLMAGREGKSVQLIETGLLQLGGEMEVLLFNMGDKVAVAGVQGIDSFAVFSCIGVALLVEVFPDGAGLLDGGK